MKSVCNITYKILGLLIVASFAYAQHIYWAKRYDALPEEEGSDQIQAIAVDADKNVYVTGYSFQYSTIIDYATIKYNRDGGVCWVARYTDPAFNGPDYAMDLAVNANGDVYVTGTTSPQDESFDYLTIKYNRDGAEQQKKSYDGPDNLRDEAMAMAIDGSSNVYVTGNSQGSSTGRDLLTVAYDQNLGEIWNRRYDTQGLEEWAGDIICRGNYVYVIGTSFITYDNADWIIIKYDKATGNDEWIRQRGFAMVDQPFSVAVDDNNSVYVTGIVGVSNPPNNDCYTIKYNSDGSVGWYYQYNRNNLNEAAYKLAIDAVGNVYVAGSSGSDGMIIKFDAAGQIAPNWPVFQSDCSFYDLVLDGDGNVMVTGNSQSAGGDIVTLKYDPAGGLLWKSIYNGPDDMNDEGTALAIDADGNVCVAGATTRLENGYPRIDYMTIKYKPQLLSDDPDATAFNWGRHLQRDIFTGALHLVYHSSSGPLYARSFDGGSTWEPNQLLDDAGKYPTVGLVPTLGFYYQPCLVYADGDNRMQYRWLNGVLWQKQMIRDNTDGYNGPPSITNTVGDGCVYLVVPVRNMSPECSFIRFYAFDWQGTITDSATLDYSNNSEAIWQPCITYDGNYNLHCVWQKDGDIVYRSRINGTWDPPLNDPPYQVNTSSNLTRTPFIETYGDYLSVVWSEEEITNDPNSREIYRRRRTLSTGFWDNDYSLNPTSNQPSESPVNAGEDCTVWCENELSGNGFDIARYSDANGFAWINQDATREYYCHSQIQRDYSPWDLYTAWTLGDGIPYQIATSHNQWYISNPEFLDLYSVGTGDSMASAYCLNRDGAIQYSGHKVDYGKNKVVYDLPFLDPAYPAHVLKGTLYFEGSGTKAHRLLVNGTEKANLKVKAGQPYEFELPIPNDVYRNNHKLTLQITSPNNVGVYLAGLKVNRLTNTAGIPGGSQAYGDNSLDEQPAIQIYPNPVRDNALIKYCLRSYTTGCISIYDATGRRIKSFAGLQLDGQSHAISWDCRDDQGRRLAPGIYFVREGENTQGEAVKLLILR